MKNKRKIIQKGIFWSKRNIILGVGMVVFAFCSTIAVFAFVGASQSNLVGVSFSSNKVPRWPVEAERIEQQLSKKGYQVAIRFADDDMSVQERHIQELIDLGARVVIVNAVDAHNLIPVMRAGREKGVKFIAHDRLILGDTLDYFVTVSMHDVGRIAAEQMLLRKAGKNLVYIAGDSSDTNAGFHREGTLKALEYAIERKDVTLQGDLVAPGWSTESAYQALKVFLERNKQVDAVIGGNDLIALGAERALSEAGITHAFIAGGDADFAACSAILSDKQTITLYKPSIVIADASVVIADFFMRGEKPPVFGVTDNGFMRVPSSFVEPVIIDALNAHLKDGTCTPK